MKKYVILASVMIMLGVIAFVVISLGAENPTPPEDAVSSASVSSDSEADSMTSASIVPWELVQTHQPSGFSQGSEKKALFVIGDPRKDSVNYDLAITAASYMESRGVEVEMRDLYDIGFNPVLPLDSFFHAKDGFGEAPEDVLVEQEYVAQADYIIFCYPNWHDSQNAIIKGYMERVFSKQFAYQNTPSGLEGLLTDTGIYVIMNAGFLGGGRGYIGDGVGIDNASWDAYMRAFEVFDNDTAGFWGATNMGRFVNDRTPKNDSPTYAQELEVLRDALRDELKEVFSL